MGHINVFFKPYKNELVYSWIYRLAKANGLSLRNFMTNYIGKNMIFQGDFKYDIRYELMNLNENVFYELDIDDIYKHNTGQTLYNLFHTEMLIERIKQNYVKPVSNINSAIRYAIPKIKICPECLIEDECKILHVEHQDENVTMCAKHACKLMEFTGKKGDECEFRKEDYREVPYKYNEKIDYILSKYISDLCLSGATASITDVKEVLVKKFKEKGYLTTWNDTKLMLNDIKDWKYKCLFKQKEEYLINKIFPRKISVMLEQLIPFLIFMFPDANDLIKELPKDKIYFEKRICETCGKESIFSVSDDSICHKCLKGIDENKEFIRLVDKRTDGQYEPLEDFVSMNKNVAFLHKECSNVVHLKPRLLLYGTSRCPCEKKSFNEGFNVLLSYKRTAGTIDDITKSTVWDGYKLGQWVGIIRRKAAKGGLTDKQFMQLDEIGFTYNIQKKKWDDSLEKYRKYVLQTGNGHILRNTVFEDYKLGQWYVDVKQAYTKGTLSEEKLFEIREIYPDFPKAPIKEKKKTEEKINDKKIVCFDEAVRLFLEYKETYKTQNIPKSAVYKEYKIGRWANQMRAKKRRGVLPDAQVDRLNAINFDWNPNETKWIEDLSRYQRYVLSGGKPEVPKETIFEGFTLGYWYSNLKVSYKNGSLLDEKIVEIRNINPAFMI